MKKIFFLVYILSALSCSKQDDWLDIKSDKSDAVPSSIKDLEALLNNDLVMNSNYPSLGIINADHYLLSSAIWQAAGTNTERNAHIWNKDIFEGQTSYDWNYAYARIVQANIVLEVLNTMALAPGAKTDIIRGSALFFRANAYYNLAQLFCAPYKASTATSEIGLPLKLGTDVNERPQRKNLAITYEQILTDLLLARDLLPLVPEVKTRPSKSAALGLLARVYLQMDNYTAALQFSSDALNIHKELLDLNTLNPQATFPFPTFQAGNTEVLFHASSLSYGIFLTSRILVEPSLYQSYTANDLRRSLCFKDNGTNGIAYRGYYTGINGTFFAGVSTNELYLVRAECQARKGMKDPALADLNSLLVKRWKGGTFTPLKAASADEVLLLILKEREKEFPFSNLRWEDLRRLNKDPLFAKTLTRTVNGQSYSLSPGDKRYVMPIADDEIRLGGIEQNPR